MKKSTLLFLLSIGLSSLVQAQFKNLPKDILGGKITKNNSSKTSLTNDEIISGLKEALNVGARNSTNKLSVIDGFFGDAAVKILMPAEAQKAEKTLRSLGMGRQVDQAVLSMNRAAEEAAKDAVPIFLSAIKGITIQDGVGILRGGDFAATDYLKGRTTASLTEAFRPIIETALKKVDATKHWNAIFSHYNKVSTNKVNPDLTAYVTEKALAGIFYQVGQEEQKIRKDPAARVSDVLKKVFN